MGATLRDRHRRSARAAARHLREHAVGQGADPGRPGAPDPVGRRGGAAVAAQPRVAGGVGREPQRPDPGGGERRGVERARAAVPDLQLRCAGVGHLRRQRAAVLRRPQHHALQLHGPARLRAHLRSRPARGSVGDRRRAEGLARRADGRGRTWASPRRSTTPSTGDARSAARPVAPHPAGPARRARRRGDYRLVTSRAARPDDEVLQRVAGEVSEAHALFEQRGWLDAPETYHQAPPPPSDVRTPRRRSGNLRYTACRGSTSTRPAPRSRVPTGSSPTGRTGSRGRCCSSTARRTGRGCCACTASAWAGPASTCAPSGRSTSTATSASTSRS